MEHVRQGVHGARCTKQAIAIGLSKARRAGVDLPPPPGKKASATRSAKRASSFKSSRKRANSSLRALRREGSASASPAALSRFAKARFRKPSSRRRESCANQVSQSAEAAPLITKLERDFASVEAALRRHLVGRRSLAPTARAWRLLGFRPEEMALLLFLVSCT
jgi:hypothetical protein